MNSTTLRCALALSVLLSVFAVAPAVAQDPPAPAAAPGPAPGEAPAPYRSPMREQCEAEMAKDSLWSGTVRAEIRREYDDAWQTDNTTRLAKDNQFVIWAYSVLWVILIGFVVIVFLRQKKLVNEIERLRAEVDRAVAE